MEILRVKVKGIRNITEAKISFDKITALVGLNGYGKSNIMDAVDFIANRHLIKRHGVSSVLKY